jgi:very-short-patch-repair endonuclease
MKSFGEVLRRGDAVAAAAARNRELVAQHLAFDRALSLSENIARAQQVHPSSGFEGAFSQCDSPLEQAYCLLLFQMPDVRGVDGHCTPEAMEFGRGIMGARGRVILAFPQEPILRFRADFLLVGLSPAHAEPRFVIVECDGEDFHSAREQRRRDAARQAVLHETGFQIIRFAGSKIHRKPQSVIAETINEFAQHGWNRTEVPLYVDDEQLRYVLGEFRRLGEEGTQ